MEFKTLKKSHKKQIIVGALAVCVVGGALTFATTRAKYKVTQDIKLVNGTVNYKVPDVRTVAVYLNDGNGDVETKNIPTNGYTLNSSKSICKVYDGTTSLENAPKDNNITIEYNNGKINILGLSKKNTRCYLYFDKKKEQTSSSIIAGTTPKDSPTTFSGTATTDEGIYAVEDGMYGGTSYYWRGAATTNHVIFANKCWRIIRINGDWSIRLIYNGTTSGTATNQTCPVTGSNSASIVTGSSNAEKYYATSNGLYNNNSYVGWTYKLGYQRPRDPNATSVTEQESNAKVQTEKWFNNNSNFTDAQREQVAKGKFCNDRNVASGYTWAAVPSSTFNYVGRTRLYTDYAPSLSCSEEDIYELKAGAITADEVMYAGGWNANNTVYYLYNGQNYWTMSPSYWSSPYAYVFFVHSDGHLGSNGDVHDANGLRPVINLRSDTTFSSGDGTQNNPYVVS